MLCSSWAGQWPVEGGRASHKISEKFMAWEKGRQVEVMWKRGWYGLGTEGGSQGPRVRCPHCSISAPSPLHCTFQRAYSTLKNASGQALLPPGPRLAIRWSSTAAVSRSLPLSQTQDLYRPRCSAHYTHTNDVFLLPYPLAQPYAMILLLLTPLLHPLLKATRWSGCCSRSKGQLERLQTSNISNKLDGLTHTPYNLFFQPKKLPLEL